MVNRKNLPDISIIIALVNGFPFIKRCLESLERQVLMDEMEVIVASRCGKDIGSRLKDLFPWIYLIDAPHDTSIPELRALAIKEAKGDIIAILEDHCIVADHWTENLIYAHKSDHPVIGGIIRNAACERLVDWAAFFCEYSWFMEPIPEGEVDALPGNNVAYKRWVIKRFKDDIEEGVWDMILHEHIKTAGIPLYLKPSLVVYHKMSASLSWYLKQKFHFARSYGGMRFGKAYLKRWFYGVGSLLLPFIMARRIILCVLKKEQHKKEFVLSIPILFLLLIIWALGEAVGYIMGGGRSSATVS